MNQYNIIMDVMGGWSKETEISVQSLVGRKASQTLVLSATLNIACKNFSSNKMRMLILNTGSAEHCKNH